MSADCTLSLEGADALAQEYVLGLSYGCYNHGGCSAQLTSAGLHLGYPTGSQRLWLMCPRCNQQDHDPDSLSEDPLVTASLQCRQHSLGHPRDL